MPFLALIWGPGSNSHYSEVKGFETNFLMDGMNGLIAFAMNGKSSPLKRSD